MKTEMEALITFQSAKRWGIECILEDRGKCGNSDSPGLETVLGQGRRPIHYWKQKRANNKAGFPGIEKEEEEEEVRENKGR